MNVKIIDYIRVELITASKKIDSILLDNVENGTLTDKEKSSLLIEKGKICLLSKMIADFELSDEIDEEAILCGHY